MWGDCLCVFQTCIDEEDAENDDLNDAGESSVGRDRLYTALEGGGLVVMGSEGQQLCNIQQKQHKRKQRDQKYWHRLISHFKLKTLNLPRENFENFVESRAFLSEQNSAEKLAASIMGLPWWNQEVKVEWAEGMMERKNCLGAGLHSACGYSPWIKNKLRKTLIKSRGSEDSVTAVGSGLLRRKQ